LDQIEIKFGRSMDVLCCLGIQKHAWKDEEIAS